MSNAFNSIVSFFFRPALVLAFALGLRGLLDIDRGSSDDWKKIDDVHAWKLSGYFVQNAELDKLFVADKHGAQRVVDKPLVCFHGYPTSSWDWAKVLPELQDMFPRVTMFDLPGYGLSSKRPDGNYSIAHHTCVQAGVSVLPALERCVTDGLCHQPVVFDKEALLGPRVAE